MWVVKKKKKKSKAQEKLTFTPIFIISILLAISSAYAHEINSICTGQTGFIVHAQNHRVTPPQYEHVHPRNNLGKVWENYSGDYPLPAYRTYLMFHSLPKGQQSQTMFSEADRGFLVWIEDDQLEMGLAGQVSPLSALSSTPLENLDKK